MQSETSSSDADDAANELAVETATAAVKRSPWSYDAHQSLVDALRATGELEKLRNARRKMAEEFPLPPSMWMAWLEDEKRAGANISSLVSLTDEALSDSYLSVDLWLARMDRAEETGDIDEIRRIGERAVAKAGLCFDRGAEIWDRYMATESEPGLREKLEERVALVPLQGHKGPKVEERRVWETKLKEARDSQGLVSLGAGSESLLETWMEYALFESDNPMRRVNVLERCVAELFLIPRVWIAFAAYLSSVLKNHLEASNVLAKATRTCPWDLCLHTLRLRALERANVDENEIFKSFAGSIRLLRSSSANHDGDAVPPALELRNALLHYGGRRKATQGETLSQLCNRALKKVVQGSSEWAAVLRRFADICYHQNSEESIEQGRGAMEKLLVCQGTQVSWWLDYVLLEISSGHAEVARGVYRRGLHVVNTVEDAQVLGRSWIEFEEIRGDLDTLEVAENKLSHRLVILARKRKQPDDTISEPAEKKRIRTTQPPREDEATEVTNHIAQVDVESTEESAEGSNKPARDESRTIFISNLASATTKGDLTDLFRTIPCFKEVRLIVTVDGTSRGIAYADFGTDEGLTVALEQHLQYLNGRKMHVHRSKPPPSVMRRRGATPSRGSHQGAHRDSYRGRGRGTGGDPFRGRRQLAGTTMRKKLNAPAPGVTANEAADGEAVATKTEDAVNGRGEVKKLSQSDFRSMLK